MSKYKVGDVAALFSKPKEPTTEAGKKLQSLFQEFHSKNKSTFQPQETCPNKKKKSKIENVENWNEKSSEKSKKRKFSTTFDQESSLNEENKKKFKIADGQEVDLKNKKNKGFSGKREFPRKKQKAYKFNAFESNTSSNSNVNGNSEKEIELIDISELSSSPKGKHLKSGFIKKSKHKIYDSDDCNYSKNEIKSVDTSEFNSNPKGKKVKSGFIKKSKNRTNEANESFETGHVKKSKINAEAFDSKDESFKEEIKEFINKNNKKSKKDNNVNSQKTSDKDSTLFVQNSVNEHSSTNSSFKNNSKDISKVSDFIRRPKKRKKADVESYDNKDSFNKNAFDDNDDDTLFKSENEDCDKDSNKKFKKKFTNNNSSKKSLLKNKPGFAKLLEKNSEDEDELSRTLFVGNLPVTTRLNELKDLFSPFGEIHHIRFKGIETDKAKIFGENAPKSLNVNYAADSVPGFIVFKEKESAVKALTLSGTMFKNRHITVDFAVPAGNKKLYDEKRSIFIGNLPFDVTDENIWDAFSECGKVEGVRVVRDRATGIGKGFGYVLFKTAESRKNALSLEDVKIGGRLIRIKAVDSNKKTQQNSGTVVVKRDTFKSRAIAHKNKNKNSRKSIKKLMKKEKAIHKKKKIASLLQKSMK